VGIRSFIFLIISGIVLNDNTKIGRGSKMRRDQQNQYLPSSFPYKNVYVNYIGYKITAWDPSFSYRAPINSGR